MKSTARVVVAAAALGLVASACTWGQYGAGPARTASNPYDAGLTTTNASTVAVRSITDSTRMAGLWSEPAVTDDSVYVASGGFLFDYPADPARCSPGTPRTCVPTWYAHFVGGATSNPVVDGNRVFLAWNTGSQWRLAGYDAAGTGNCSGPAGCPPLWTATWGSAPSSSSAIPLTVAGGRLYVLTEGLSPTSPGTVTAFDEAGVDGCSGTPVTCQPLFATTTTVAPRVWPAVANGHLYADAADHSAVLAFDAAGQSGCSTGVCSPQFRFPTGSTATVSVSGNTAYAGVGTQLRAFDANGVTGCSGAPRVCGPSWTGTLASSAHADPPAVAGGHVFVALDPGLVDVFDAKGTAGCTGAPAVCQPLWSVATGGNTAVHLGATKSVLVASWLTTTVPGSQLVPRIGIDVFDLAGNLGCTGAPKVCGPIGSVDLGAQEAISSPAVAGGRIVVITGFSGIGQVIAPAA